MIDNMPSRGRLKKDLADYEDEDTLGAKSIQLQRTDENTNKPKPKISMRFGLETRQAHIQ